MNKSISKSSFDNKQIDHNDYIIDKYGKELHQIFNYYCSFGSFSNNQHLKSTNFTKLIKESELVINYKNNIINEPAEMESIEQNGIHFVDIDILLAKISNIKNNFSKNNSKNSKNCDNSKNLKIDFNLFLKSIEICAQYVFPKKEIIEAIDFICLNHFIPLLKKSDKNQIDYSILDFKKTNNDLADIYNIIYKTFLPIYDFYAGKETFVLNFEKLLK